MRPREFHHTVRRVLLPGDLHVNVAAGEPPPLPQRCRAIEKELSSTYETHDHDAVVAADRYRSTVWAIYGLTALATPTSLLSVIYPHSNLPISSIAEVAILAGIFLVYSLGRRKHLLDAWLQNRRLAERLRYLPLTESLPEPIEGMPAPEGMEELCRRARASLAGAWQDDTFLAEAVPWLAHLLASQQAYHHKRWHEEESLQHRVHRISTLLFVSTFAAAVAHLWVHAEWLTTVTASLPALGAALNGALAQLESQRLARMSRSLEQQLGSLREQLQAARDSGDKRAIAAIAGDALRLVLREHEDWWQTVEKREVSLA